MYIGAYTRFLNDGQIILPKEILSICKDRRLFLTVMPGPYIICLEEDRWKKLEESVARLPSLDKASNNLKRFIIGNCYETTCPKNGKLNLPPKLTSTSNISDELLVIGLINRFEIWNKEIYENKSRSTSEKFLPKELVNLYGEKANILFKQLTKSYISDITEKQITTGISTKHLFLCHSFRDKDFVRRLAKDLTFKGVTVWFDEWEMLPGDSLYEKIQKGITDSSWFAIVLSENSIDSNWCRRELHNALEEEFKRKRVFVIPILYRDCDIPGFLKEKVYVNMIGNNYEKEFDYLLRRFEV